MLNRIIHFSISNKLVIGLLTIGLILWGSYSLTQLPIDAVPDITNNQVQVITVAPSQSAPDIERLVTSPVEQSISNIPGLEEIRSFSRFGLSVVTIVFEDAIDVYWARQQVGERLSVARNLIPPGVGTPELAPVTTGLGEIYQYIIRPKPAYEGRYSTMELRTIQDWIVRRQLLGTKGVADVSSFGGHLKQYEIALDPQKLRSLRISISDVFGALEKNNQNTGGAYIEKDPVAYFIRSEGLLQSLDDIGNIVIENKSGIPVLIKHIGSTKLGHAIRFGAMTRDGTQETVGAVVMMLKGENSSQVIQRVKDRMVQIEKTLPEGLVIEPFLDRTKLVNNAIETVARNLAEGALIVVLVLILLLGNWKAGLLVASVIPLAMLFAFSMMNVFNVSGNLMSLGAIDFGLIVDGAVIIVEATLLHIVVKTNRATLTAAEMDQEVSGAAQKMMSAAAFGQIIILIVYLPILSLAGIEGKMFKPMAQTVAFAILGALILSLTYVPVASSLFLSKKIQQHKTFSDRLMEWLRLRYEPIMNWSLHHKTFIISSTLGLFIASVLLFNTLGGEFLPELDEGDFAVETRLLTGSSLTSTVEATIKGQQVLLKHFPEVEKVIGKIGSSEIPTDPMPIEAADMMVIMKNKSQWTTAQTKNEMIEKMQKKLEENIPGVFFGFQHPIQMRFNELMTGARQDVVIKIYGEDLDRLSYFANQIGTLVSSVDGAEDLFVERATGLPQIVIRFNRERLGAFGINILDINNVINASLAGQSAGMVYEGEKRFNLVVRLSEDRRQSIEDIRSLFIPVPNGGMITLNQVADVEFQVGPNQIQRDDAKRRIIVGFNVRGRDVESIVNEVQQKINTQIQFDPGYYAIYGGSFKNLEEARGRLIIAVPISLALIFILLFFTFHSIKLGTLIFTAIPLSAIGGILALWIRGMPFSISAGVGFIALFGVSVLNGIVLIAEFNRLKKDGLTDLKQIVMKGTQTRLRPVLMTATVASLGFLPMALSQGSGAEVQKPLATVVIGGLVSATFLTLIVLPCLYVAFDNREWRPGKEAVMGAILLVLFMSTPSFSQKKISLPDAIEMAIQKHPDMKAAMLEIDQRQKMKKASGEFPKTSIMFMKGQYNTAKRDNNITLTQTIPLTALGPRQHLASAQLKSASFRKEITRSWLTYQVSVTFNQLLFTTAKTKLLIAQDSLFADLVRANSLRYQAGDGTLLEKISAETQAQESKNLINMNEADVSHWRRELQLLVQSEDPVDADGSFSPLGVLEGMDTVSLSYNPHLKLALQAGEIAKQERKVEVNRILPDLHVGYFNQTLIGYQNTTGSDQYFGPAHRFSGFLVGISLPLWFFPNTSSLQAAKINEDVVLAHAESQRLALQSQYSKAQQEIIASQNAIKYYLNNALPSADLMMRQGTLSFKNGEIDYVAYLVHIRTALGIQENYLALVKRFNEQIIHYQYLQGL